jgi:thymidylate synthase
MSEADRQYNQLLWNVLTHGKRKGDRTGTGTISIFGAQARFDLRDEFPLITTKKIDFSKVVAELLWFLSGSTNVMDLQKLGCHIWDPWADPETGQLGPVYGEMWRFFPGPLPGCGPSAEVDQISTTIENIKKFPNSRRHVVSAWQPTLIPDDSAHPHANVHAGKMAIAPCHCLFQFYVCDGVLSCQLYQRSADLFIGVPFNIASYALLTHMVAQQCDLDVGEFIHTFGDLHLYSNHETLALRQRSRRPKAGPKLRIGRLPASIFEYEMDDFSLEGYDPHPFIKAEVAV